MEKKEVVFRSARFLVVIFVDVHDLFSFCFSFHYTCSLTSEAFPYSGLTGAAAAADNAHNNRTQVVSTQSYYACKNSISDHGRVKSLILAILFILYIFFIA